MKKDTIFHSHHFIEGDSWPDLGYAVGKDVLCRFGGSFGRAHAALCAFCSRKRAPPSRSAFAQPSGGKKQAALAPASARTRIRHKIRATTRRLQEHRANGDVIVIASGSLDLYPPILFCHISLRADLHRNRRQERHRHGDDQRKLRAPEQGRARQRMADANGPLNVHMPLTTDDEADAQFLANTGSSFVTKIEYSATN